MLCTSLNAIFGAFIVMHHLLQDIVTAEEDYLQRGDLSSLSILSQPAHNIVVVDAPDNSSSDGLIGGSFDAEQCWSTSNHQEEAWMNVLRKRSRHHKCSQRCKLARRSGSSTKPIASEEIFGDDTRPHVVVIDSLSSSSRDGHFQRRSSRIWDKKNSQRGGQPEVSHTKTKRRRAQDKLHKQQLSSPRSPLNPIPKTQPFSVVVKKLSRKDILDATSNSGSSSAECITLRSTQKRAPARTTRSKHRKTQASRGGLRERAPRVTGVGVQKQQHTGQTTSHVPSSVNEFSSDDLISGTRHSGGDSTDREISSETAPKKSVAYNFVSQCSPEDLVPVRGLRKKCARVINDTMEEMPSIMDSYSDTPSTFSLDDFAPVRGLHKNRAGVINGTIEEVPSKTNSYSGIPSTFSLDDSDPVRGLHKKRTCVINDTLEEMPHELTTSEPSINPVCPRSQRDALSLEEEELLEENLGKDDEHPAHQSEELPKRRENVQSGETKTSQMDACQSLQGVPTSVVFDPINVIAAPSKNPKRKKVLMVACVVRK